MSENTTKPVKQWYQKKRWIIPLILIGLFVVGAGFSNGKTTTSTSNSSQSSVTSSQNAVTPAATTDKPKDTTPVEYLSALAQAKTYSDTLHMSKKGVYDQLVSEYGGKFTAPAAQYAIDNIQADWNANALASAKTYQSTMKLSPAAIKDQLTSDYGGKFTLAEANFAIANLNK